MSDKDFVIIDEEDHKEDGKDSTIVEEQKETSVTAQGEDSGDDDEYEKYCLMCHRPESVAGKDDRTSQPHHGMSRTVCRRALTQ